MIANNLINKLQNKRCKFIKKELPDSRVIARSWPQFFMSLIHHRFTKNVKKIYFSLTVKKLKILHAYLNLIKHLSYNTEGQSRNIVRGTT